MLKRNLVATGLMVLVVGGGAAWYGSAARVSAQSAPAAVSLPTYELDPNWPPKLPNGWVFGPVVAVVPDSNDNAWILHRPKLVADNLKAHAAPPVVVVDPTGKFIRAWGGAGAGYEWPDNEHTIGLDNRGSVWIGGNAGPGAIRIGEPWRDDDMLLQFSTDGKFKRQFGHRDQSRGNKDTNNLREPADMSFHLPTNEIFVADGYGNRRVVVLDAGTMAFKRMWGAFGKEGRDVFPLPPVAPEFKKGPVPPKGGGAGPDQYWIVHSIAVSKDGLVYVSDREYGRVQVFDLAGKYIDQFMMTPADAKSGAMTLSPDPQQQMLYIGSQGRIVFVDRKSLRMLGEFRMAGLGSHHMGVDSKGNVYMSQNSSGTRKLRFAGTRSAATR